jgi:hypothetical protein
MRNSDYPYMCLDLTFGVGPNRKTITAIIYGPQKDTARAAVLVTSSEDKLGGTDYTFLNKEYDSIESATDNFAQAFVAAGAPESLASAYVDAYKFAMTRTPPQLPDRKRRRRLAGT